MVPGSSVSPPHPQPILHASQTKDTAPRPDGSILEADSSLGERDMLACFLRVSVSFPVPPLPFFWKVLFAIYSINFQARPVDASLTDLRIQPAVNFLENSHISSCPVMESCQQVPARNPGRLPDESGEHCPLLGAQKNVLFGQSEWWGFLAAHTVKMARIISFVFRSKWIQC